MVFIESSKTFDKEENHAELKERLKNSDIVQYPLRIPASLYKQVKMKLLKEDKKLKGFLVQVLEDYVNT